MTTTLQLITILDPGIYQSDRDEWAEPVVREATQANLAYLLDLADYRRLYLDGCYGNRGSGTTTLYLVRGDEPVDPDEMTECAETDPDAEIWELDEDLFLTFARLTDPLPEGAPLTRDEVNAITGDVWDGENHVEFVPVRSARYCTEPDEERYRWGTVTYTVDRGSDWRGIDEVKCNDGWSCLAWLDQAGLDGDSLLTRDEAEWAIENPPADTAEFSDNGNEVRALYCRADAVERITAEIRREAAIADV